MNIFNDNQKLEALTFYGMDWGLFLRHNMEGAVSPFIFLKNGEETFKRVLMTDGNPVEYAVRVLQKEERPFQQFVIGCEGYLRNEQNERVDAMIVQAFDITQPQGVMLGQMFSPKTPNSEFKKIGRMTLLGQPALPLSQVVADQPDYHSEPANLNGISMKADDLTKFIGFVTHDNPSVIGNGIRQIFRGKLTAPDAANLNGQFEINIHPGVQSIDFLRFCALSAINEERHADYAKAWEDSTGRNLLVNCIYDNETFLKEF